MDDVARARDVPDDRNEVTQTARREFAEAPHDAVSICLIILVVLAIFYTLYLTAELVLPIVFAIVLKMLLQPAMRVLTLRLHAPVVLAALCLVVGIVAGFVAVGFTVSGPAADWLGKAPRSLSVLEERLQVVRRPIETVEHVVHRLEALTTPGNNGPAVAVQDGGGLGAVVLRGTRTLVGQLVTLCVVLFFLLAAGDTSLRRLVEILPTFGDKKRVVEIVNEVEQNISLYLLTITAMNAAVGIVTGLAMWACGIADPMLWGVAAFLLNYAPILGPTMGVMMFFLIGLLSYASFWLALLPAGAYLAIHIAEGEVITPMLLARRFTLNPVIVIVSLFFWYWMWGMPGALLAVPLLAIVKIVCDHIPSLTPLGHLIGADAQHGETVA